jgi:Leucine-rich repeat (LRR) protein
MAEINLLLRHAKRSNSKVLDLSNKDLTSVPKEVFTMSRTLEDLNLSHNSIAFLEPEVK